MVIKNYEDKYYSSVLELIEEIGSKFVPSLQSRTTNSGFLDYILGRNMKYLNTKYKSTYVINPTIKMALDYEDNLLAIGSYFDEIELFQNPYISSLLVYTEHQKKGIGSLILDSIIDDLSRTKYDYIYVTTWSTNEVSRRLLTNKGFELYKRVKDERKEGIDGLYFRLKIK